MTAPASLDDPVSPRGTGSRRRWRVPAILLAVLLLTALVRGLLVQSYVVPDTVMAPTAEQGDRVLVAKTATAERGDLVVVKRAGDLAGADRTPPRGSGLTGRIVGGVEDLLGIDAGEQTMLARVVAVGGDTVTCCTTDGALAVDGKPVPGSERAGSHDFQVVVPAGGLWVLADAAGAGDSLDHVGSSQGGALAGESLVGVVVLRYWPLTRVGALPGPTPNPRGVS
jgi:signal peptidase I